MRKVTSEWPTNPVKTPEKNTDSGAWTAQHPASPPKVTQEHAKLMTVAERRRQRAAAADRETFEKWARGELEASGFRPGRKLMEPPAADREAAEWWKQLGAMAVTYRRAVAELASLRAELAEHPPHCPTCGGRRDPKDLLAEHEAQVAHIRECINRFGWIAQ